MTTENLYALDDAQLATILAALRYYQQCGLGDPFNRPDDIHEIATNEDMVLSSLDDDGIDALCESLNHTGLTLTECLTHFGGDKDDPHFLAAQRLYHRDGELELHEPPIVSEGDDPGAYVLAWQWVSDHDAGVVRDDGAAAA